MAGFNVKKGSTKVPGPKEPRASFVLGSRPDTVRAPAPPRIKPMTGQTQYGKGNTPNPAGASFGDTGQSGWS